MPHSPAYYSSCDLQTGLGVGAAAESGDRGGSAACLPASNYRVQELRSNLAYITLYEKERGRTYREDVQVQNQST